MILNCPKCKEENSLVFVNEPEGLWNEIHMITHKYYCPNCGRSFYLRYKYYETVEATDATIIL